MSVGRKEIVTRSHNMDVDMDYCITSLQLKCFPPSPTLFSTTETTPVIVANNSLHLAKSNILVGEFILLHCEKAIDKTDHIFLFKTFPCMTFRTLYLFACYLFYLQLCLFQHYLVIFIFFPTSPPSFGLRYPTRYLTYFYLGV